MSGVSVQEWGVYDRGFRSSYVPLPFQVPRGIIQPAEMPTAVDAIKAAVLAEEAEQKRLREQAQAQGEVPPDFDSVSLRLRSTPFVEMLQRCAQAQVEIVWGV